MDYQEQLEPLGHWEDAVFHFNETQLVDGREVDIVDCTGASGPDGEELGLEAFAYAVISLLGLGPEKLVHDKLGDSEDGSSQYGARPPGPEDN